MALQPRGVSSPWRAGPDQTRSGSPALHVIGESLPEILGPEADVAQPVDRLIHNQQVNGSIPFAGSRQNLDPTGNC